MHASTPMTQHVLRGFSVVLPVLSLLGVRSVGLPAPRPIAVFAHPCTDTGAAAEPAPVLLTATVLAAYIEVGKALKIYWAEHPDQAKAAAATHTHTYDLMDVGGLTASGAVFDYASLAQQDTGLAALFTRYHVTPVQFEPTKLSVLRAIGAFLLKQSADSTTVVGQNIAAVQAHRQELADDWRTVQGPATMLGGFQYMMQNGLQPANPAPSRDTQPVTPTP